MRDRRWMVKRLVSTTLALGMLLPVVGLDTAHAFLAPQCLLNGSFHFEPIPNQHLVIMSLAGDCQSLKYPGETVHVTIFATGTATTVGKCSATKTNFINGVNLDGEYTYTRSGQSTETFPVWVRLYFGNQTFPGPTPVKYRIVYQKTNMTIGRIFLSTRIYSMCPPAGDDTAHGRPAFFSEPGDPLLPII